MYRFYVIVLLFSVTSSLFSAPQFTASKISGEFNNQPVQVFGLSLNSGTQSKISVSPQVAAKSKHSELMPTSMAVLLIAVGFALVFLDDHLKKSKNRKK